MNGLNLKASDIDILVVGFDTDNKKEVATYLQTLLEELVHFKWVEEYKGIYTA